MSNICYAGKVTITPTNGKPLKGKNTGTINLFNILCNVLCGTYTSDRLLNDNIPVYISIVKHDTPVKNNYSEYSAETRYLSNMIAIESKEVDITESTLKLNGILRKGHFLSLTTEMSAETATCDLLLLTSSGKILAAYTKEFSAISSVYNTTNNTDEVSILWELTFSNKIN